MILCTVLVLVYLFSLLSVLSFGSGREAQHSVYS